MTALDRPAAIAPAEGRAARVVAVDAGRGLVMLMTVSVGFGLGTLSEDPTWGRVGRWFHHVPWEGAVAWDMIQPAFLVLSGTSMAFAYARRRERGSSWAADVRHAAMRAVKLILWSQVLIWIVRGERTPQLVDALSQLAIAGFVVVLVLRRSWRFQAGLAVAALVAHTALHHVFPGPDGPWSTQLPVGLRLDQHVFRYDYYDGVYSSLNALPSIVWVLAGCWIGTLLRGATSTRRTAVTIAAAGALSLASGLLTAAWIPCIKQLCTASFVLISLGVVALAFAGLYALTDVLGASRLAWPLVVMGRNTLVVYSIDVVLLWWVDSSVAVFTSRFGALGLFGAVVQAWAVATVVWLVCWWLHRHEVVVKF